MPEKDKITAIALKAANELAAESLRQKPTPENGLFAALISILSVIACELHSIKKALNSLNKE